MTIPGFDNPWYAERIRYALDCPDIDVADRVQAEAILTAGAFIAEAIVRLRERVSTPDVDAPGPVESIAMSIAGLTEAVNGTGSDISCIADAINNLADAVEAQRFGTSS